MKKILIFILLAAAAAVNAQGQTRQDSVNAIHLAEQNGQAQNTGVSQDILSNYLQVAAKNISSTNGNFQLKLNWFSLNSMDSLDKYANKNFRHTAWQRNGEFVIAGGLNTNNKAGFFKSFQGGFNYNFLNRRDTADHYYTAAYLDYDHEEGIIRNDAAKHFQDIIAKIIEPKLLALINDLYNAGQPVNNLKEQISAAIPGIFQGDPTDQQEADKLQAQLNIEINERVVNRNKLSLAMLTKIHSTSILEASQAVNVPLNAYFTSYGKTPLKFAPFISSKQAGDITNYLNTLVKNNKVLHGTLGASTLEEVHKKVLANYEELVKYVSRQPLLTFGYLYTYGTGTTLSSHVAGFTYLQGLGGVKTTHLGQLNASLTDTLTGTDPTGKTRNFGRNILALRAGYNQVVFMLQKASVLEVNAAAEEDYATQGYVMKTDNKKFYLDAYVRARLPKSPWLKFDFKFDPKGGNVFGFLDFTYNLDKQ